MKFELMNGPTRGRRSLIVNETEQSGVRKWEGYTGAAELLFNKKFKGYS